MPPTVARRHLVDLTRKLRRTLTVVAWMLVAASAPAEDLELVPATFRTFDLRGKASFELLLPTDWTVSAGQAGKRSVEVSFRSEPDGAVHGFIRLDRAPGPLREAVASQRVFLMTPSPVLRELDEIVDSLASRLGVQASRCRPREVPDLDLWVTNASVHCTVAPKGTPDRTLIGASVLDDRLFTGVLHGVRLEDRAVDAFLQALLFPTLLPGGVSHAPEPAPPEVSDERWTSPDRRVALTAPSGTRFGAAPTPRLWELHAGRTRLLRFAMDELRGRSPKAVRKAVKKSRKSWGYEGFDCRDAALNGRTILRCRSQMTTWPGERRLRHHDALIPMGDTVWVLSADLERGTTPEVFDGLLESFERVTPDRGTPSSETPPEARESTRD